MQINSTVRSPQLSPSSCSLSQDAPSPRRRSRAPRSPVVRRRAPARRVPLLPRCCATAFLCCCYAAGATVLPATVLLRCWRCCAAAALPAGLLLAALRAAAAAAVSRAAPAHAAVEEARQSSYLQYFYFIIYNISCFQFQYFIFTVSTF